MIPTALPAAGAATPPTPPTERPRQQVDSDAWRGAWQREVERHQATDWFAHGLVGAHAGPARANADLRPYAPQALAGAALQGAGTQSPSAQPAAPGSCPLPAARPAVNPAHEAAARVPRALAPYGVEPHDPTQCDGLAAPTQQEASARPAAVPEPPCPLQARPLAAKTLGITGLQADSANSADIGKAAAPAARHAQLPPTPEPVRIHAQWSGTDVRLWLGMDVAAAGDKTRIVQQLQRSVARSGYRVVSVICNGQAVLEHPRWSSTHDGLTPTESSTWLSTR